MNLHLKKTKDYHKLEDRFQKKAIFQLHICKIADKKTAYNEGRLYSQTWANDHLRIGLTVHLFVLKKLD